MIGFQRLRDSCFEDYKEPAIIYDSQFHLFHLAGPAKARPLRNTRLRADARGRDGGICEELAAEVAYQGASVPFELFLGIREDT
jgi:hypothetical protein